MIGLIHLEELMSRKPMDDARISFFITGTLLR